MAVNTTLSPSKLKLSFSHGVDDDGKEIVKTKTYSNVKAGATDEDIFDVAETLINLQDKTGLHVERFDEKEITQA